MASLLVSANLPEIFRENKFVQIVCESNAISEEQFVNKNAGITKLEMCHNTLLRLESFRPFLALKELCIVNQPIVTIEYLHEVPHLEALWLSECKLTAINGLEHCTNLKSLYLYSNKIEKIENINHLTKLEVLWLGDNKLSSLEGLRQLVKLRSLWVQGNQISAIGFSLENNTKLKELNISRNNLSSFRDISAISRLSLLERLWFSDSTFGDNPICHLCNYQTHALAHLRSLQKLDGAPISDENRKLAESTYAKKKMYYNMKVKTMKRWMGSQLNQAAKYRDESAQQIYSLLLPVRKEINTLENLKDEREHNISRQDYSSDVSQISSESIDNKIKTLNEYMQQQYSLFKDLDVRYSEFQTALQKYQTTDLARIHQELESGGNIRLELGAQADTWVASCEELIHSRYFSHSSNCLPPTVKVARIYRIHNRHLRSQFETAYLNQSDEGDEDSDGEGDEDGKRVEYLFYGDPIEENTINDMKVDTIFEMGFPSPAEYSKHGLGESVPLSNCINLPDATSKATPRINLPPVKLLIVKSLIGKTMHVRFDENATKNPNKSDYPNMDCVFRARGEDTRQKEWYFFDTVGLLPEYLVEFEYILKEDIGSGGAGNTEDTGLMTRFQKDCAEVVQTASNSNCREIISEDPVIAPREPVPNITDEWLHSIHPSGFTFSSITYLNISCLGITKLEGLSLLVHLRILKASYNNIRKIEGLTDLKQLETLDLSNNMIRRIEGLKGIPLRALYLHSSFLSRLDDVILLKKYVPDLVELDLRDNPVRRARGYKILVLRRLPKLSALDGAVVTAEEKAAAREATPTLTPTLIRQHAYTRRHSSVPIAESLAESDDWWTKVVALNLRHCGIRRLVHFDKLVNLKKADLGDNLIGRIDGLDSLKLLEDLLLDENCISRLDGLSKLAHLRKLDVSRNQIFSSEGLESLTQLVQLALEDNMITSLSGIQNLTNLMELYLGNNKISDRRETRYFRNFDRLVILDMSGNDVSSTESFRLFIINKLRHLKVLDGQVIESEEQNASKDKFAARLTSDVLEEKVGHIQYSSVRSLDLSNMKLKEIDSMSGDEFSSLRELTLDNNVLTSAKGLMKLTALEVLRLNHNRIENLGFGPEEGEGKPILPKLEVLELSRNCVASMVNLHLSSFPNLKVLVLTENAITRLEGMDGASKLQKLILDKNKIKSVDESNITFANLPHLSVFQLEENFLKVSACFSALSNLKILMLGQNRISDILELDRLALPRLEELTLAGNAVARKLHYRAHAISSNRTLKVLDGRPVTDDERTKAEYLVSTGVVSSAVVLDKATDNSDPLSPNGPKKVALKPNMIDFGQMLALGTQVKGEDAERTQSPKEWNSLPGKPTPPTVKAWKSKKSG